MKITVRQLKQLIKEQVEEQWKQHAVYSEPEPKVSNDTDDNVLKRMVGKTFSNVQTQEDELIFSINGEPRFKFYHEQDCCEHVEIADLVGDLFDLEGTPLLRAEAVEGSAPEGDTDEFSECVEWTFYKFTTVKGHVTVSWRGESNGYYSVGVTVKDLKDGHYNYGG